MKSNSCVQPNAVEKDRVKHTFREDDYQQREKKPQLQKKR